MILRLFYLKILFLINIYLIFCSVVYDRCRYEKEDEWAFTKTKDGAENGWSVTSGYYKVRNDWLWHFDANEEKFWIVNYPDFNARTKFDNVNVEPYFITCENEVYNLNLNKEKTVEWTKGCVIDATFYIQSERKSIIFEKKGETCSDGYIEYEWNNNEWVKIQCATNDECNGNDPNKI